MNHAVLSLSFMRRPCILTVYSTGVHNNVQQFFQDIDLKRPIKDKIRAALADYMVWQPDTGHRMTEGLEMMMTEQRFRMLFLDMFKETAEVRPGRPLLASCVAPCISRVTPRPLCNPCSATRCANARSRRKSM